MAGTHSSATPAGIDICIAMEKGGDKLDMGDPETRLLAVSTIGWLLVGALTTILIRKRKGRR
jgi:hypothetical protein